MFVSSGLYISHFESSRARFAKIIALIYSAIRDSTPVIRHISANLVNSIAVVIVTSGVHSVNTTRLRHTHYTSI